MSVVDGVLLGVLYLVESFVMVRGVFGDLNIGVVVTGVVDVGGGVEVIVDDCLFVFCNGVFDVEGCVDVHVCGGNGFVFLLRCLKSFVVLRVGLGDGSAGGLTGAGVGSGLISFTRLSNTILPDLFSVTFTTSQSSFTITQASQASTKESSKITEMSVMSFTSKLKVFLFFFAGVAAGVLDGDWKSSSLSSSS